MDNRYVVEQRLLPTELYSSGAMLLTRVLGDVNLVMEHHYAVAGAEYPKGPFSETHRVYYHDEISVLIIRIEMPVPESALHSRAVYLCYSDKNGKNLYFTSELTEAGKYVLCCRPGIGTIKRIFCGDTPEGVPDEFDKVADNYWGLVINDGLKQLEGMTITSRKGENLLRREVTSRSLTT